MEETMILVEKWDSFCSETKRLGTEKVTKARSESEKIIEKGHSHSHKVETWRATVDEMWDDLLELMETRKQLLESAYRRHKYSSDAKELLDRLDQKSAQLAQSSDTAQLLDEARALKDQVRLMQELLNIKSRVY